MKTLLLSTLITLFTMVASAQELLSTTIDVSASREFIMLSSNYPSHVNAIACRVLAPVVSIGGVAIMTTLDGELHITPVYDRGTNVWMDSISVFQTVGSSYNAGYQVGDTFSIPINRSYTKAKISVSTFGGSGKLVCSIAK